MFDKLEDLLQRFEEILNELSEPSVTNDQKRPQGSGIRRSLFRERARSAVQQRSSVLHGYPPCRLFLFDVPRNA